MKAWHLLTADTLPEIFLNRRWIFLMFLLIPCCLAAQLPVASRYADPSSDPPDLPVKLLHLTAQVGFVPEENLVNASAHFTFTWNRKADSIIFMAPGFKVKRVTINDTVVPYRQQGGNLIIYPDGIVSGRDFTLSRDRMPVISSLFMEYSASPPAGNPYFIGWRPEEKGRRKQIWAHRPHGWLPYLDARITTDFHITVDQPFRVFSNGERLGVRENGDGTSTWHYAMRKNHPFFSTALVIGEYEFKQGHTAGGVPLEFWYYPDMADRLATTYLHTEKMFSFLENELQFPYPYPLYRQAPVADYMYGAMETTTSTIFGDFMFITPRAWWQRNYVNVNVHELAHQWFGNCVVHLVNRDVWLTESFATYYAKIFEKEIFGEDYWQNVRNEERELAFHAAARNNYPVGGSRGGNERIYQKGSLVLEMLRDVMGDEDFKEAMHQYLHKFAFGHAETNDFIRCVYEAAGKSYFWFFDQWVLRGGEPSFQVADSVATDSNGNVSTLFRVRQVQEINELNGLFRMPVRFEVHYKDGTFDPLEVWIENQETVVKLPNEKKKEILYVLFDPGRKVLKKVDFPQPMARRMAQASHAAGMIDRYDALVLLRDVPLGLKSNFLAERFDAERFHLVKNEILKQLANDSGSAAVLVKGKALTDSDALVRKGALLSLGVIPGHYRETVEKMLYDSSFINVELSLELLCISFPDRIPGYLEETRDMEGWRGKNIRMKWLEIAIMTGQEDYLEELKNYCTPRYEFETRINAFLLLKRIGYRDDLTMRYAREAEKHWNRKLSGAAREYLNEK